MTSAAPAVPFPGGTWLSHLRVYDWPAPDGAGQRGGGTPHLHTASSEGYVVLAGSGSVQTLCPQGFSQTTLAPGVVVWFTPGVVHRLVNDGGLEILVVMSLAGLAETGDAVLTFAQDILGDPGRYREAATLPVPAAPGFAACPDAVMAAAVRARRDLAVEGFAQLRAGVQARGPSALADLYAGAATLVAGSVPRWQEICANGVLDQGAASAAALADLGAGRAPHLWQGAVASRTASCGQRAYGLCGRLQTWSP